MGTIPDIRKRIADSVDPHPMMIAVIETEVVMTDTTTEAIEEETVATEEEKILVTGVITGDAKNHRDQQVVEILLCFVVQISVSVQKISQCVVI